MIFKYFYEKKFIYFNIFFLLFASTIAHGSKSELRHDTTTGIGNYLDLTQSGVSEYVEFLNIGSQKEITDARSQGINPEMGIDEDGEMMEGILYVWNSSS